MNTNANPSGDESLSGPAAEALLAYLRRKDDTGNSDVSEFVKESPQFADYEDLLRSHAEAALLLGGANGPLPNCGETVTFDAMRRSGDDTTPPAAHSNTGVRPDLPEEIAFTTHVREIARHAEGGLGVVCRGEDALLNREVAIKFIRPEREEDVAAREIFMLEAEITGRLDHPGVAPVHGIGETESGRRFYVMRYMPGESLADRIRDYHAGTEELAGERIVVFRDMLARFASVCKTIAYAHSRGILHRDIKPHNVMLGRYGETIVVDWGLATPIQPAREHRVEGERTLIPERGSSSEFQGGVAGTLSYMPPEQAAGDPVLFPSADIYALGATLYHLMCGRPPMQGVGRSEAVQKIIKGEYPLPRSVDDDISPVLEAICLKAMSLDPEERYTTALQLAEDVERYLADEPVSVLPDNVPRRIARWGRHHPGAVQIGAVSLMLLLLSVATGSIVSWVFYASAVASREATLRGSAEIAAIRWATDLSLRWQILQHWADDSRLHQPLRKLDAMNDAEVKHALDVQQWLDMRAGEGLGSLKVTSWYVNDAQGRLLARYPPISNVLELRSSRWSFRSYFHGGPNDSSDKEKTHSPLRAPHLSAIYLSKGEETFRVALSVPVRDAEETIGVLTMTIDLDLLNDADLIDMRLNNFGGTVNPPMKGIYLDEAAEAERQSPQSLFRATDDVLSAIEAHIEAQDFTSVEGTRGFLIRDYVSPLDPPGTPSRQAAIAPVFVDGKWTGLVAVVEQAGG